MGSCDKKIMCYKCVEKECDKGDTKTTSCTDTGYNLQCSGTSGGNQCCWCEPDECQRYLDSCNSSANGFTIGDISITSDRKTITTKVSFSGCINAVSVVTSINFSYTEAKASGTTVTMKLRNPLPENTTVTIILKGSIDDCSSSGSRNVEIQKQASKQL